MDRGTAVIVTSLIFASCGGGSDKDGGEDSSGGRVQCDVPALFEASCAGSGCHNGDDEAAGLDLVTTGVADRVSLRPSTQCSGYLADPAHPTESVLYTKVLETNDCGAPMPVGGVPLDDEQLACLEQWIEGLLPPPPDTTASCPTCECEPKSVQSCYDGASGTEGDGLCVAGEQECTWQGQWGPCVGAILPSFEDCTTSDLDEDCDGEMPACGAVWSAAFGTEVAQAARSVGIDSQGNVYLLGDFAGAVDVGTGPLVATGLKSDIVLAKLDSHGTPIWAQAWGDTSNQYATKLTVDKDDNVVIMGRAFGKINFGDGLLDAVGTDDVFIAKFSPDGAPLWSAIYGGVDPDRAERLTTDADGDVIITGTFTGEVDFGLQPVTSAGLRDAFVMKLDGDFGIQRFVQVFGGAGDDYGFGVSTDAANNVYVSGRFQESLTIGANALASAGGYDVYLAKLDPTGDVLWAQSFGTASDDLAQDLVVHAVDGGEQIVLLGHAFDGVDFGGGALAGEGERDIFLAAFDLDGVHQWSHLYGDATDQFDTAYQTNTWLNLAAGPNGEVWMGGGFTGTIDFGPVSVTSEELMDMLVFGVGGDGSFLGAQRFGGQYTEMVLDLDVTADGAFAVVGGRFFSLAGIDFGPAGSVTGAGSADGVIARIPL